MSASHVLAGRCPSSQSRRPKTAYPGGLTRCELEETVPLTQDTLSAIQARAREMWSFPDREDTTYSFFHNEEHLRGHQPPNSRPTSPTRKNKPHPPLVFLACRLHNVPGYHNADATIGKEPYKVDGSVPAYEQERRNSLRRKYVPRPHTAAVMPYRSVEDEEDPEDTEGWQKLSSDKDKMEFLQTLKTEHVISNRPRTSSSVPALRGYLKRAGYTEAKDWVKYQEPENYSRVKTPVYYKEPETDRPNRRSIYKPVTKRGDYLLHPDWPPTLRHHRLPCLC